MMTTTATIRVPAPAASPLEAKIVSSDVNSLHLEDDEEIRSGSGATRCSMSTTRATCSLAGRASTCGLGSAMLADYYTQQRRPSGRAGTGRLSRSGQRCLDGTSLAPGNGGDRHGEPGAGAFEVGGARLRVGTMSLRRLTSIGLVVTLLSGGCATTATIRTPAGARAYERRDDVADDKGRAVVSPLEVTIVGSDARACISTTTTVIRSGSGSTTCPMSINRATSRSGWARPPSRLAPAYWRRCIQINRIPKQPGSGFVAIGYLMGWTSVAMGVG